MTTAIIGFGDLGRYIEDVLIENSAIEQEFIYFDDQCASNGMENAYNFAEYRNEQYHEANFYVCLGYQHLKLRRSIIEELLALGRSVPSLIHSSAYLHPCSSIGPGSFLYPGVNVDRNVKIGLGTWIANGSTIAHDCTIGDACWFGANTTLCGKVSVDNYTFLGSSSTIANDISVGSEVVVGMSSSVAQNIPDRSSVVGNPLKFLDKPLNLI